MNMQSKRDVTRKRKNLWTWEPWSRDTIRISTQIMDEVVGVWGIGG